MQFRTARKISDRLSLIAPRSTREIAERSTTLNSRMVVALRKTKCTGPSRSGLTLVELLAALTLSAMIMAVLLGLVARFSQTNNELKKEKPFEPWLASLKDQLQQDYVGCRSIIVSPRRIRMEGYASFPDANGMMRTGPCRIDYQIVTDDDYDLLFRQQRSLLGRPPDNVVKELVCRTISRFRSLDALPTDVAPGVLRIEMTRTTDISVKELSDPAAHSSSATIPVVLVRHGAVQ